MRAYMHSRSGTNMGADTCTYVLKCNQQTVTHTQQCSFAKNLWQRVEACFHSLSAPEPWFWNINVGCTSPHVWPGNKTKQNKKVWKLPFVVFVLTCSEYQAGGDNSARTIQTGSALLSITGIVLQRSFLRLSRPPRTCAAHAGRGRLLFSTVISSFRWFRWHRYPASRRSLSIVFHHCHNPEYNPPNLKLL